MSGIGSHHSAAADNTEWLTPPHVLAQLGAFDLDPASPEAHRRPWPTAAQHYAESDNGLAQTWRGRVYLNPPYTTAGMTAWLGKLADHGHGTALTFARTETAWFFRNIWERATALLFMETPRLHFYRIAATPHLGEAWKYCGVRAEANCGGPTVLAAYGHDDADRLAGSGIAGAFVPLTGKEQVVVVMRPTPDITWPELVEEIARRQGGRIELATAYVLLAQHPKAAANPHWRAQIRKIVQRGAFKRVAPATYALAGAA